MYKWLLWMRKEKVAIIYKNGPLRMYAQHANLEICVDEKMLLHEMNLLDTIMKNYTSCLYNTSQLNI